MIRLENENKSLMVPIDLAFKHYKKQLFTLFNYCVAGSLFIYAVIYYAMNIKIGMYSMLLGALFFSPLIHFLNQNKYHHTSRILFMITGNAYIFITSLSIGHVGGVKYFLMPAAIVPFLIFEKDEKTYIGVSLLIALLTWIGIQHFPTDLLFGSAYLMSASAANIFTTINFVVSTGLSILFVKIYQNLLLEMQKINLKRIKNKNRLISESRDHLLEAQQSAKLGFWEMNCSMMVSKLSQQTAVNMMVDGRRQELPFEDFFQNVSVNEYEVLFKKIKNTLKTGQKFEAYCTVRTADDNKIVYLEGQLKQKDKWTPYIIGSSKDVTNEYNYQMRLQHIFETLHVGAWEWDVAHQKLKLDGFLFQLVNYQQARLSDPYELFRKHVYLPDQEKLIQIWYEAVAKKQPAQTNFRLKLPNGSLKYLSASIFLKENNKNEVIGAYGIVMDITEVALKELDYSQLKNTLQQEVIFCRCDLDGRFREANEKLADLLGYSVEKLNAEKLNYFELVQLSEMQIREIQANILEKRPWYGEIQLKKQDSSEQIVWTNTIIVPVTGLDDQPSGIICLHFDTTPQKKLQTQLIQSSKLTSLGEMAGGIAHEINTPLSIIMMRCSLLNDSFNMIEDSSFKQKSQHHIKKIEDTTERIAKIVKNLKTFSRKSENDPDAPVSLETTLKETLELCSERFLHHGIKVDLDCKPDFTVWGNSVELSQVFMNLLSNSYDAIEKNEDKWIKITVEQTGNKLRIYFVDSGNGIPKDIEQRMMNPFFTTKEMGKGTGLGLSLSLEKVKKHGGTLQYELRDGHTCFVIELEDYSRPDQVGAGDGEGAA